MGYSVYDWFDDLLAPKLKEVLETFEKNEDEKDNSCDLNKVSVYSYDVFIKALKDALRGHHDERFTSQMLHLILNPEEEEMDLIEGVKKAFYMLTSCGETLHKIEYRKDAATTVVANYQDFESEE